MNRSLTFRWASRIAAVAAILLVSVTSLFAQQRVTVSGTVFDESNLPMVGVGVMQKGTTNGVATDLDGKYTISVPAGSTLVFSSIGYLEQEISAPANGGTLNVSLLPDTQTIEETVVVGYGVQKKSDLTGSISSVKEVDLSNRTLTDAAQALQGKTAGVYISMSSGSPGSEGTVRIRGVGTNGNSRPLYVIDGSISRNGISNLNPEDIESMEILKDGASTAIYGARAGNGVILVTTKRGSGDGRISYQLQTSLNTFGRLPEVMNSQEFYDYYLENGAIPQSQMDANWDKKTSTNWVKELTEPSFMQRHNVTFQKGDPNGNIFVSAQYMKNDGPVKGDKDVFERMNFTLNGSWRFKKWLQLQTNNQFGIAVRRAVGNGSLTNAVRLDPHTPAF
ncbi:MAG: TonB-dependent receptor plug domain-containing protein [Bacteroidales bacterium]|nr:TonB-dependent receptor plug domain-containing protein [Bacteroidales bacterium]